MMLGEVAIPSKARLENRAAECAHVLGRLWKARVDNDGNDRDMLAGQRL